MAAGHRLERYRAKRDFSATPEPGPGEGEAATEQRFVVQEHHARRLHWDLRLERDGVLVSWAVPKGVPPDPSVNHLAVPTEDHPLEYLDFEAEIPKGQYGAGRMTIWDRGTYECHKWEPGEVMVTFHGKRLQGRYVLFRTAPDSWMIHRMDPPQDPGREPMPQDLKPMRARRGRLPKDDKEWAFEIWWAGTRVLLFGEGGRVVVRAEDGSDLTDRYPELGRLGRALGSHEVVLDGELVGLDREGQPEAGPPAVRDGPEAAVRRTARDHPVAAMLFDLLYLDGHPTTGLPYRERRDLLSGLGLAGPHWQTPAHHVGDGAALLAAARAQGLPGVVAKRLDSPYEPGRTSRHWIVVPDGPDCRP